MIPTLFAACDTNYFLEHGISFIRSGRNAGHEVRIAVYDLKPDRIELARAAYRAAFDDNFASFLTPTFSYRLTIQDNRAFYASLRFLFLPEILQSLESVLVLDIDSLVLRTIDVPDKFDFGLFLREDNKVGSNTWEIQGMKVAAGLLYVKNSPDGIDFAKSIEDYLRHKIVISWFCDQHAIYETFKNYRTSHKLDNVWFVDNKILDWEFSSDSFIWTAKGSRKNNKTYLNKKDLFGK